MALHGFDRVLRWADFTAVRTPRTPGLEAETFAGFAWTLRGSWWDSRPNGNLAIKPSAFRVRVGLQPGKSWVLRGKATPFLLWHEQGHYDISAIAGRQFLKDALQLEAATKRELDAAVNSLHTDTIALMGQVQAVYDDPVCATAHGANEAMQADWWIRIWAAKNDPNGRLDILATCLPPVLPTVFSRFRLVM
jgi:hypothetical protein